MLQYWRDPDTGRAARQECTGHGHDGQEEELSPRSISAAIPLPSVTEYLNVMIVPKLPQDRLGPKGQRRGVLGDLRL